jgi:thiol-disulfide isomerase/thioredoxin
VGKQIPDIEVRDTEYKPVPLSQITKGKGTILTLWAPWCGGCVAEFPAFQALADRRPGELQIVAPAVQDPRLNMLNFILKHPEYKFIFLTDPNLEDDNSAIAKFFVGEGIPRNAFVDPKGRILEYHVGSYRSKSEGASRT